MGTIAMGIITRSAAFIKFAAEHNATIREVRGSIRNFGMFG